MHLPFDILKKERDGSFRWFEAINDLGSANIRIREIIALSLPAPSSCRGRFQKRVTVTREPHLLFR
jgi:hypothetical protein